MTDNNILLIDEDYGTVKSEGRRRIKLRKGSFKNVLNRFKLGLANRKLEREKEKALDANYNLGSDSKLTDKAEKKLTKRARKIAELEAKIAILSRETVPRTYVESRAIKLKNNMIKNLTYNCGNAYSIGFEKEEEVFGNATTDLYDGLNNKDLDNVKVKNTLEVTQPVEEVNVVPEQQVVENNDENVNVVPTPQEVEEIKKNVSDGFNNVKIATDAFAEATKNLEAVKSPESGATQGMIAQAENKFEEAFDNKIAAEQALANAPVEEPKKEATEEIKVEILRGEMGEGMPTPEQEFQRLTGEVFDPTKYEIIYDGAMDDGYDSPIVPYRIVKKVNVKNAEQALENANNTKSLDRKDVDELISYIVDKLNLNKKEEPKVSKNGSSAAKLNKFDADGNSKKPIQEQEVDTDTNTYSVKPMTPEGIQDFIATLPSKDENTNDNVNVNDYKPMTPEEIAAARENIEFEKYEEKYREDMAKAYKDKLKNAFIPVENKDIVITKPVVQENEDNDVKEEPIREVPQVVPERQLPSVVYDNIFENKEATDQDTEDNNLHFDYSDATENDIKDNIDKISTIDELALLKERAKKLKEEQKRTKEEYEAAIAAAAKEQEEEKQVEEEHKRTVETFRMFTEAMEEDCMYNNNKTQEEIAIKEAARKAREAKEREIEEMLEIMGPIATNVNVTRGK